MVDKVLQVLLVLPAGRNSASSVQRCVSVFSSSVLDFKSTTNCIVSASVAKDFRGSFPF